MEVSQGSAELYLPRFLPLRDFWLLPIGELCISNLYPFHNLYLATEATLRSSCLRRLLSLRIHPNHSLLPRFYFFQGRFQGFKVRLWSREIAFSRAPGSILSTKSHHRKTTHAILPCSWKSSNRRDCNILCIVICKDSMNWKIHRC